MHLCVTDMVLEESPSKGPDAGEDKVNLIKFTRRISRSIMVCQQAFQQGTQCLNVRKHKNKSTCQHKKGNNEKSFIYN